MVVIRYEAYTYREEYDYLDTHIGYFDVMVYKSIINYDKNKIHSI